MKYDFIETFSDIDDEYIASAKPVAQKPVELKPETRRPRLAVKKIAAAAACLAVLGGGMLAVKSATSDRGADPLVSGSPLSSGSGVSLSSGDSADSDSLDDIITSSSTIESKTEPDVSAVSSMTTSESNIVIDPNNPQIHHYPDGYDANKWKCGTEFVYEGKSYKVISHSSGGGLQRDEDKWVASHWRDVGVGVRREIIDGVDTVEFVAFVENYGTEPLGIMSTSSSPDKPILFRFEVNDESIDTHNVFDYNEFKHMAYVIQPGEAYYQKASFPVTEEEYMFSTCFAFTHPDKFDESKSFKYNSTGSASSNRWADFSDKSVSFDNVDELFGASNLSKALEAAAKKIESESSNLSKALEDKTFGGYDNDSGFSY